ncbi:MAG: conjugal transfer protein, partial [Phenylobacterium sp.]
GIAQINVANLDRLGLSLADAFDPCANLAASARVLADGYRRAAPAAGEEQRGLRTALSYYNTGHPDRGLRNGYVTKVVAAAARLSPAATPARAVAPPRAEPPAWDVFGRARLVPATFVMTPSKGALP